MPKFVRDDGSPRARAVLIGEAPGFHEDVQGIPFVGWAGQKQATCWRSVGLQRSNFYITNVYPYRPPQNKLSFVPRVELETWVIQLHDRLAALEDPWVLVPTGNTALRALIGKGGITRHRGSIYSYTDKRGRAIKVIPTIHPAALSRTPRWEKRWVRDWQRIASDLEFRELRLPEREHFIRPTIDDCNAYLADAVQHAELLSLDIETPRELKVESTPLKKGGVRHKRILGDPRITCIGFSYLPEFSLTIPTTLAYWQNETLLAQAWEVIRLLCALPCEKALQNGYTFDSPWLHEYDLPLHNFRWDTMSLHHWFDPLDSHSLEYMASIDTREPYWKDEAKDPDEMTKWTANLELFWTYNGKDVAVTRELADCYIARHAAAGTISFYHAQYSTLFQPLIDVMRAGICVNDPLRRRRLMQLKAQCIMIQDRLSALAGEPLYGKKSLSNKKLQRFLYETLRLPPQKDRKTKNTTVKETAIRKLMLQFPEKLGSFKTDETGEFVRSDMPGPMILTHRRKDILSKFYEDARYDPDGYIRCTYKIDASSWRLKSSKNWRRTGSNIQNTDREARDAYMPDPGCIFLEVDLSQAEDRVVRMLTQDAEQISVARSMPWELDVHRLSASKVFRVPQECVNKEQRYLGKRAKHATNYDMHGLRLSEELLKDGYILDPDDCERMIEAVRDKAVTTWQMRTRQEVLRNRALTNSWGCVIDFTYERLADELYRLAYAWRPQSEVGILLNQWGLKPGWAFLRDLSRQIAGDKPRPRINVQMHDALLISTPPDLAFMIAVFLKSSLERPRVYAGNWLIIPCEIKLGATWKGDIEFKQLPSAKEFRDAAYAVYKDAPQPR